MLDESVRICCVGFQKTGTSSVAEALERLGYSVTNVNREVDARLAEGADDPQAVANEISVQALRRYEVIQDSPAAFVYEALDKAYPQSKFIFTHRPFGKWVESYRKFFPDENNALRAWMYGVDKLSGNEARYREVYEGQNAAIRSYFADRPGDFLEMDLSRGDGWLELVSFLGADTLPRFPHMNAGKGEASAQGALGAGRRAAKQLLRKFIR